MNSSFSRASRRTFRACFGAALGLLAFGATTGSALAQSSQVTVFGVADAALRSVSNQGVGQNKSIVSGSNSTSRLGLRGSEDLGGGLSASFHLEHGLSIESGAAVSSSKFWDRRATVGLSDKRFGEVRLGRDYVPTYTSWTRFDPFSYVGVGRSADFFSGTPTGPIKSAFSSFDNTLVRADRAVQYLLPAAPGGLAGLEGGFMAAAGENREASAGKISLRGFRLGFDGGSYYLSAATSQSENSLTTTGAFKDRSLGASVKLGLLNVSVAQRELSQAKSKESVLMLAAVGTMEPHVLKAAWIKADFSGTVGSTAIDANDATKLALGYQYNLSKRSALYLNLARISNDGAAKISIPGGNAGMAAGGQSQAYEIGMRHSF